VGIFLFVFQESILILFFFLDFFSRLQFQRGGADNLKIRAAFVTTDGVAFVYVFLVHVDRAIAYRTRDHEIPPEILLYDILPLLQLRSFTCRPGPPNGALWWPAPSPSCAGRGTNERDESIRAP